MKKKLILLVFIAVSITGCDKRNADGTYTSTYRQRTYVIDSCEYIGILDLGNGNYLAHKGNCKFCTERRKQELRELLK